MVNSPIAINYPIFILQSECMQLIGLTTPLLKCGKACLVQLLSWDIFVFYPRGSRIYLMLPYPFGREKTGPDQVLQVGLQYIT